MPASPAVPEAEAGEPLPVEEHAPSVAVAGSKRVADQLPEGGAADPEENAAGSPSPGKKCKHEDSEQAPSAEGEPAAAVVAVALDSPAVAAPESAQEADVTAPVSAPCPASEGEPVAQ